MATAVVTVPAMVSIAVAMRGGNQPVNVESPSDESEVNARYDAYVPLMRASEWTIDNPGKLTLDKADHYADMWVSSLAKGDVEPLPLTAFRQSLFNGASGQIIQTETTLAARIESEMHRLADAGQTDRAADEAVRLIRLSGVLRYSELSLHSLVDTRAERGLEELAQLAPAIKPAHRKEIRANLIPFRTDGGKLADLCRNTYSLYLDDLDSFNVTYRDRDRCPNLTPLQDLPKGADPTTALKAVVTELISERRPSSSNPFETVLVHTLNHEAQTQTKVSNVLRSLD